MEDHLGRVAGTVALALRANVAFDELDALGHFRQVLTVAGAEVVYDTHLVAVVE